GRERSRAQRPLPSMMIATWRGRWPCTRIRASNSVATESSAMGSDFHDLGFLALHEFLQASNEVVVHLLQVLLGPLDLVFGYAIQLLEPVASIGARVPHGNATILRELVNELHHVAATLLVHRGNRH